jgi:hypothetical protein
MELAKHLIILVCEILLMARFILKIGTFHNLSCEFWK